ncbi:thiamine pyrophosphate-requiring protein [Oricola nitratireducens]|uniref:thiamine pyrophosphate-requiring protein n=1 Tax=Oricola nitratireducens TaxID=2775868 RepID=UPI001867D2C9|nr:thiamine pyrophosphate-requiring protein [Oricola nitratireducens]
MNAEEQDGRRLPANGAESVLTGLKSNGVDYLFANAGTDFPPIIEALASLDVSQVPQAITIPHETASVGMAHGYYLVTGKPQAVMVHVNVGLANAAMGVINAASDNVPVIVMSGRTPITESGRLGSRITPIQYGQEMYDQASLVSNVTKFHYEMRYPEQGAALVARAAALAKSEPKGPVYLSLPREPLAAPIETPQQPAEARPVATRAFPDLEAIAIAAEWLAKATSPVVLCQRGDTDGVLGQRLSEFCNRHGIGVAEPFTIRNVMASSDPMFLGYDAKAAMQGADVVVVLDSGVPWIEALHAPSSDVKVIHVGADPHFARMPVRGYKTDLAIAADPVAAVEALAAAMTASGGDTETRRTTIAARAAERREKARAEAEAGCAGPMTAEWMSRCLSDAIDDRAVVFSELGVVPGAMDVAGPNRIFNNPHSGGLGWALPAALGAQLADRERLVAACIGDGSYIFANPVACHQIAEALELPVLTIIKNNGMWNAVRRSVVGAYPQGVAVRANTMPLTSLEPAPDYLKVAEASRAHTERVEHGRDLPAALGRAIDVIRSERRQAVLDVRIAVSEKN